MTAIGVSPLQLLDLVLEQGGGDRRLPRLAVQPGLGELLRLVVADLAGQRRLVRVDRHVDQRRPGMGEGLLQRARQITGLLDVYAEATAPAGPGREVRLRLAEPDSVLGVAQDHLLP